MTRARAAGHLLWESVLQLRQAADLQHVQDLPGDFLLGELAHLQAKGHVVKDVQMGEQGVALEHQTEAPLVGGYLGDIGAVQGQGTAYGLDETGHHPQRGGLAAAAGTQQGHQLALLDVQVQTLEHLLVFVVYDVDVSQ